MSLKNKIIFITGASSGIGKACAEQFAALGCKLILTARRLEKLEKLAGELKEKFQIEVLTLQLDVQDKKAVKSCIESLSADWKDIDILINNAGLALSMDKIQDGNIENWETMIQTNICGLLYVSRAILPLMLARKQGHIVNIGSIAAVEYYPGGNVYSATKHAVRAISQSMRVDLLGSGIKVTEIDPGAVETEFSIVRWKDEKRAAEFYQDFNPLLAEDVAESVIFACTRKKHVNIAEILIIPTDQASANHLHRPGKYK